MPIDHSHDSNHSHNKFKKINNLSSDQITNSDELNHKCNKLINFYKHFENIKCEEYFAKN